MSEEARFKAAFPYQKDVFALPAADLDTASQWYCEHFGMVEVERVDEPARRAPGDASRSSSCWWKMRS